MSTPLRPLAVGLLLAVTTLGWAKAQTEDFASARDTLTERSGCPRARSIPAGKNHGPMAHCVLGQGGSLIWELERSEASDQVQRARITWFDFGVDDPTAARRIAPHVDRAEAERLVGAFLDLYAPADKERLLAGFFGEGEQRAATPDGGTLVVQQFRNPSLVERRLEVWAGAR